MEGGKVREKGALHLGIVAEWGASCGCKRIHGSPPEVGLLVWEWNEQGVGVPVYWENGPVESW